MWSDIFLHNSKFLIITLNKFISDIQKIKDLINKKDIKKIFSTLKKNKEIRRSILKISSD